jgi:hypothetical protein
MPIFYECSVLTKLAAANPKGKKWFDQNRCEFYETMTDFESSSLNECRKTERRTGTAAYPASSCRTSTSQKQFISRAQQSGDPPKEEEGISGESQ